MNGSLQVFRQRLRLNPNDAQALAILGALALREYQDAKAETLLRRAIAAGALTSDPYCNLALLLKRTDRLEQAHNLLESVRDRFCNDNDFKWAYRFVSNQNLFDESPIDTTSLYTAKDIPLLTQCISLKRRSCNWQNYDRDKDCLIRLVEQGHPINPFFFVCLGVDADLESRNARLYVRRFASLMKSAYKHTGRRVNNGRLRIGYISADFREHPLSYLVSNMIEAHDRTRFEIYIYATVYSDSPKTDRIRNAADVFKDLSQRTTREAAALIFADCPDILVDMTGYADGGRPEILALKPAPVQINYLGFPGTMGAPFIDYLIADCIVAPAEVRSHSVERIIDLDCFQPNDGVRDIPERFGTLSDLGLPSESVILCSFAQPYKISPDIFNTWLNILGRVPRAVLWLLATSETMSENLRSEARKRGVDPARLHFSGKVKQDEHLSRHMHADLILDTFPVGAFTTASDALWAGVPLVTCIGPTPAGRGAASILTFFGTPELVTASLSEYEELAVKLAANGEQMAEIKKKVQYLRNHSPLFDTLRHTRQIEKLYEAVVRQGVA